MSAIWGVVALEEEKIPENCRQIFEDEYRKRCKIDRYDAIITDDAFIGCGVQHITSESRQEQIPFADSEHKLIFTADCILDNREELIDLLVQYGENRNSLNIRSDSSLIYLTYLQCGVTCVKYLRGLFMIAVWNREKRNLTLISDPVSSRCLYYTRQDKLLIFSTLLQPILNLYPHIPHNEKYCKDFLLANRAQIYVVPGETPFEGVRLMLPATIMTIRTDSEKSETYWTPEHYNPAQGCRSALDYGKRFMELYSKCVKDCLRTTGEIGIAMSSGLDSASVGVLASQALAKEHKTLYSYTFVPYFKQEVVGRNNLIYDETDAVNEIVRMYPNISATFLNNHGRSTFDCMPECSDLLEMPYKTGTFPSHYEMCQEASTAGCKVMLNGGFGNSTISYGELPHIFYDLYLHKHYLRMLTGLNRYGKHEKIGRRKTAKKYYQSFKEFSNSSVQPYQHFIPDNHFLDQKILKDYSVMERFSKDRRTTVSYGYIDSSSYPDYLNAASVFINLGVFETKFGLNTGMILRDPTKDVRMLSFCRHLPYHIFAEKGVPRWLIHHNFENLLPQSVISHWSQHALLNIDWIDRINRDWNEIKPVLLEDISSDLLQDWIQKNMLTSFIQQFDASSERDQQLLMDVCAVENLARFLKAHPVT